MVVHYQNQVHQTMLSQGHLLHSWGNLVLIMQVQLCVRVWQMSLYLHCCRAFYVSRG